MPNDPLSLFPDAQGQRPESLAARLRALGAEWRKQAAPFASGAPAEAVAGSPNYLMPRFRHQTVER